MIIKAFKNKTFALSTEDVFEDEDKDEDLDKFYTSRELETILELSNFENEKETPIDIMPELESAESPAQRRNQRGQGVKMLTPQQMLSRLPISLAQLKAGNNSEKLKNEIRQLLYALYRSKKLSKTMYKHLMNTI